MASPVRMQIGFAERAAQAPRGVHRCPRRARSLLSIELLSSPARKSSIDGITTSDSCSDLASLGSETVNGWAMGSGSSLGEQEGAPEGMKEDADACVKALPIPYSRAARARLDAAERKGKAFDQQLELLGAVRAYFAEQQRGGQAQAGPAAQV